MPTLFTKIINREIPAQIVHEDEHVVGFRDINPQAPLHVLFVPRREIATLNELTLSEAELVGRLVLAAAAYAQREGFGESGYRTVFNCNRQAGQSIFHVHLHVIGGRPLNWPPG